MAILTPLVVLRKVAILTPLARFLLPEDHLGPTPASRGPPGPASKPATREAARPGDRPAEGRLPKSRRGQHRTDLASRIGAGAVGGWCTQVVYPGCPTPPCTTLPGVYPAYVHPVLHDSYLTVGQCVHRQGCPGCRSGRHTAPGPGVLDGIIYLVGGRRRVREAQNTVV